MDMQLERAVPSGIITMVEAFFLAMGLQKVLDDMLPFDDEQCKLTPGQRITALMLCVFGGREALYRVEKFFLGHNLVQLFGPGVQASDFNDDALGRALDKLCAADPRRVFSTLSFHALTVQGIPWQSVHADTTSVSLYGAYEGFDGPAWLRLVPGYSKDGHPELNQLMLGMATTRDGIPLFAEALDGNTSDKGWNLSMVKKLAKYLPEKRLKDMLYVADSSLVTKANLQAVAEEGYHFVSRLPATFREAGAVRDEAFSKNEWVDIGRLSPDKKAAEYKLWETERTIDGRTYRLIVVHSTSLDRRKQKQLDKTIAKERADLERWIKGQLKEHYNCKKDAEAAFLSHAKPRFWRVSFQVQSVEEKRYGHPGRPRKDETPDIRCYHQLQITVDGPNKDAIAAERERRSAFVLISNDETRSAEALLREYKEQSSVEQGFRFIKEPRHVSPIFLKRPGRIEAFVYVQALALLIYTLIQKKIRDALANAERPLHVSWRGEMRSPTARVVLDVMETIQTVTLRLGGRHTQLYTQLSNEQRYILELLGLDPAILIAPT